MSLDSEKEPTMFYMWNSVRTEMAKLGVCEKHAGVRSGMLSSYGARYLSQLVDIGLMEQI